MLDVQRNQNICPTLSAYTVDGRSLFENLKVVSCNHYGANEISLSIMCPQKMGVIPANIHHVHKFIVIISEDDVWIIESIREIHVNLDSDIFKDYFIMNLVIDSLKIVRAKGPEVEIPDWLQ